MPGEMPFCKISWKRTCFVKYAWWNAVLQKEAEREHALSNFVKYAWWNAVLQKQAERKHALSFLSSMPGEMPLKHVLFQLAFAKRHFTRPTWQTCSLSACFCKKAFHLAYLTNMFSFSLFLQTGIPSGMLGKACSLSALLWKTAFHQAYLTKHVLFQLAFAKRHFTRHTWQRWQNMFSFSFLLQKGISLGLLDKACSLSACFCKTAFHEAYLTKMTKHVLFQLVFAKRHFTRHTWQKWQSMFSFSLCLQNDISPGILDKACSLSACFCKTALHQAYLTKHVLLQLVFAKRHFTRHNWQR